MWSLVGGPFLAAAALLVLAGLPKLKDPLPLVRAMRSARLPASRRLVRALAAAEVLVGVAAFTWPSRLTAAAVAASYAGFSVVVLLVRRRGGVLGSCGCFGKPDTPATRTHAAVTAVLAVAAAALAVDPGGAARWSELSPAFVVLLAYAGLLTWLAYLVMAVLPATTPSAVRSAARRP